MPCSSPEVLTRFAVEPGSSPYTFDSNSERIDPYDFKVRKQGTIVFPDTIRGTRSQASERTRLGPSFVGGSIAMPIDVAAMDLWLPRILGGTESADSFPVAEDLPSFALLADLTGRLHQYSDCYVDSAVISGHAWGGQSAPQPLLLQMNIVGKTETLDTSFPAVSISTGTNTAALLFEDGTFTINAASRPAMSFRISINNSLKVRWTNSLTPTCIYPTRRIIRVEVVTPYTATESADTTGIYNTGFAGAAATINFVNGNTSFGFTFGKLQYPIETPVVAGRGEVVLRINGVARSVTTTKEIVGNNDSTA